MANSEATAVCGPAEGSGAGAQTLVDVVSSTSGQDAFPGLYLAALPDNPFLGM